ncbi:hypothetical protein [Pedobacter gandavensis]|uniref:Lipoprotein n=1 Tax=Pedobacter gandavensis TaxID=2679963 RepID=A0ABR6EV74_9SPHI|nr:hypothetical protein [Pedobacter gandavensis]MBB2149177.1 hypothetical protein [Pedobacter gandavensis]
MKKSIYTLAFLIVALSACKTRNVNKTSDLTHVNAQFSTAATSQSKMQEKLTIKSLTEEKSGIWIWDEWYSEDSNDTSTDTGEAKVNKPIHRRTTFTANNKKSSKQSDEQTDLENQSKQSVYLETDSLNKSDHKDTESKSSFSWVTWLLVTICVIIAIRFIIKEFNTKP